MDFLEGRVVNMVAGTAFPTGSTIELDGENANLDRFFDTAVINV